MSGPLPKAKAKQRTWKPQEVALVERLRNQGLTFGQIACNIGVTKNAVISLYRNRIDPVAEAGSAQGLRWRIRQLVTAGYGPHEIAERIGAPLTLTLDEFARWEAGE